MGYGLVTGFFKNKKKKLTDIGFWFSKYWKKNFSDLGRVYSGFQFGYWNNCFLYQPTSATNILISKRVCKAKLLDFY